MARAKKVEAVAPVIPINGVRCDQCGQGYKVKTYRSPSGQERKVCDVCIECCSHCAKLVEGQRGAAGRK